MRDFVLVKLTDEEFDDFSARHPQGNFQQTSAMGRLRTAQGIDVEYLALKEGEKIVAAALFETHRSLHLRSSMMARCATITTPKH